MTNARVEKDDQIGKLGEGWAIAQTTLGYERGANSLGRVTRYNIAFSQLVKAAKLQVTTTAPYPGTPGLQTRPDFVNLDGCAASGWSRCGSAAGGRR